MTVNGHPVRTGIFKAPVDGPVAIKRTKVEWDEVADLRVRSRATHIREHVGGVHAGDQAELAERAEEVRVPRIERRCRGPFHRPRTDHLIHERRARSGERSRRRGTRRSGRRGQRRRDAVVVMLA